MSFLALLTRCKDEPYVAEFVAYYLSQGVDHIYILDDDSDQAIYARVADPRVTVVPGKNITRDDNVGRREFYPTLRHYQWLIHVDLDEYIATRKHPRRTIRRELETTFRGAHLVRVPWVFMACNSQKRNPPSLLQANVYRPHYDRVDESPNRKFQRRRMCKSIFRPAFFNELRDHGPVKPTGAVVASSCELTEATIPAAVFVCYHYRYVSIEHFAHKTKTNVFHRANAALLREMLAQDHPDVLDETMRNKSRLLLPFFFKQRNNMFLALLSRCKDEPYVAEFVAYYLSEGVDHIYLLDDDSDQAIYAGVAANPRVTVVPGKNITAQHNGLRKVYPTLRHYQWLIHVDLDEYLSTRQGTIRSELETTFRGAHCVEAPWVFMACNSQEKNPPSLLQANVYRPNYDLRHEATPEYKNKFGLQRCCKSIFRPAFFAAVNPHGPIEPLGRVVRARGATGWTEQGIRTARLVCYHFRYVSIEHFVHKTKTNKFYRDKEGAVQVMLAHDYPEVLDETLRNKSLRNLKAQPLECPP